MLERSVRTKLRCWCVGVPKGDRSDLRYYVGIPKLSDLISGSTQAFRSWPIQPSILRRFAEAERSQRRCNVTSPKPIFCVRYHRQIHNNKPRIQQQQNQSLRSGLKKKWKEISCVIFFTKYTYYIDIQAAKQFVHFSTHLNVTFNRQGQKEVCYTRSTPRWHWRGCVQDRGRRRCQGAGTILSVQLAG